VSESIADLLRSSGSNWKTLRCAGVEWTHYSRSIQAQVALWDKEWAEREESGQAPSVEFAATTAALNKPHTEEIIRTWRMWVSPSGQLRVEYDTGAGTATTVVDGEAWWAWWPSTGLISNANGEETNTWHGPAEALVYPKHLPIGLDVESLEEVQAVARRALRARAVPKPGVDMRPDFRTLRSEKEFERYRRTYPPAHWALGMGADEYELLIDTASGIVLRSEARHERRLFHVIEISELTLDEPSSKTLFSLLEGRDF
jgi:hypothetical protein